MKRKLSIILALCLLVSSYTIPAFSAIKVGSKCNKVGAISQINGQKYICLKSGKRTVWGKIKSPGASSNSNSQISTTLPITETKTAVTIEKPTLKYPSVGDTCEYDNLLAYRYSLVPGYTKPNELRWIVCGRQSTFEPALNVGVDEKTYTPIIPTAVIHSSDLNSYDDVSSATQAFVNSLPMSTTKSSVKMNFFIESSVNGYYLELIKSDLENVMSYYEAIGITAYMPREIKIFLGVKNANLDSMIKKSCRSEGLAFPGGTYASMCDDNYTGMFVINIAANVLGGMNYNQDADWRQVTKSREMLLWLRWSVLHELYHQFPMEIWGRAGLSTQQIAPWIVEGAAQAISFYFLAKESAAPNSYQYLWEVIQLTNLVPPGEGPENGPEGCTNSASMLAWNTEDSRRQCQYTQGMLIVETFVARYGIEKWVKLVVGLNQLHVYQFDTYFQSITGENLQNFYKLADEHSRKMGYQIKKS